MFDIYHYVSVYSPYVAPPIIGAFIGYLTNKVAIKMLFRPLKPWRLFGIRLPMTPGVIPSKRHDLAVNIGKMVGTHLLTSKEIGRALQKDSFQRHLGGLITGRVGGVLERDLPPLPQLIPKRYGSYFDIAAKTLTYQLKKQIHRNMQTEAFAQLVERTIHQGCDTFLSGDIDSVLKKNQREIVYISMQQSITKILASRTFEQWLEDFFYVQVNKILKKEQSLQQILPQSLIDLLLIAIEKKTPDILEKVAEITRDPEIQDKIVEGVKKGVDTFAATLGPMAKMVQGFLTFETIEKAVKDYLQNNEEDIARLLKDKGVQERVVGLLLERVQHYLHTPISAFLSKESALSSRETCKNAAEHISALLQEDGVAKAIMAMLQENIEVYIQGGAKGIDEVFADSLGEKGLADGKAKIVSFAVTTLRSPTAKTVIDAIVDKIVLSLLQKRIGKLANLLPGGVRDGLYDSLRKMASAMLATEVPGLVSSLNIQHIVAEKVNSLDLLRLEELLLSIMEEQFKYINLFGALLGLLIGTLNVVLIQFL